MKIDVPREWERIDLDELRAVVPILGATDVGKSTFSRWLFEALKSRRGDGSVALLDGDPGQSILGPPATLTVAFDAEEPVGSDAAPDACRTFIGSTSPRGHFLELLTGAERLIRYAEAAGADAVLVDGSGFIDPRAGGVALKWAELELFRPRLVFAIQRAGELEPLLAPLRRSRRVEVQILRPSPAAHQRSSEARRQHRARQYARHFAGVRPLELSWSRLAVLPAPHFRAHQLVGLENGEGFLLALGIVLDFEPLDRSVRLLTPLPARDAVRVVKLGDVTVDPDTFRDTPISLSWV